MFHKKLKEENHRLRIEVEQSNTGYNEVLDKFLLLVDKNTALKAENERLAKYIEDKKVEEKAELERVAKMANFWSYDGRPQTGDGND